MSPTRYHCAGAAGAISVLALAASANAMPILEPGFIYQAHNHPDGNAAPPPYGLRLDELYDATSNHDRFTFDFDFVSDDFESAVFVGIQERKNFPGEYVITVFGNAWGGRDTNGAWANDQYLGEYQFEFTYAIGAQLAPGDDDFIVDPDPNARGLNSGTIITPLGDTIDLTDEAGSNPYTFRLGNEDDNSGHRGFDGISGWGWLNHNGEPHVKASDWLFTVESTPFPTPGAVALFGLGGLAAARRRR